MKGRNIWHVSAGFGQSACGFARNRVAATADTD
jgi:hypothetical protein